MGSEAAHPQGWETVSLGEISTEQGERGGTLRGLTVLSSTKYRGLVPSYEYFKRAVYSHDLSNYKLVRRNWFAYATNHLSEGSIGLQSEYDAALVSPIYTVFSTTNKVHPTFLIRLLKSEHLLNKYAIHDQATVDRRGAVRYRDFASILIDLPPIPEQRRIADILDAADAAIRQTEAVIAKLRQMKAGLLHDLLTRGLDEQGRLRDPGAHPELFKDSPLGRIPREWEVQLLSDVAQIGSGVTLGRDVMGTTMVELPYLRVANVQDGHIDIGEIKSLRLFRSEVSRFLLQPGDVLMTEGGDFDKLGRGAVWQGAIAPCVHQNHIFRVRVDRTRLLPDYLAAVSASQIGKRYFLRSSKQTTNLASINSTQLKAFPVPCPPLNEQHSIVVALEGYDTRIRAEESSRDKLKLQKRGLMHDLLTGRVRV